jgi:GDP-L-fucose synthase|tara:strand:+ start:1098 stop:1994 length:897 start_codon:yes stop_codon:yes gene_type:complete
MKTLITGGNGQLGRELRNILPTAEYTTRQDCDLTDQNEVREMYRYHSPDIVVHTAALVGNMPHQISNPTEYLSDNVKMNTLVVDEALKFGIKRFIAITSTGIYPNVDTYPIKEEQLHDGPPTFGFFSYSIAKRTMAVHIDAIKKQYGLDYCHLAVGNMYGIHDRFDENSHFIATMMKEIAQARATDQEDITLYGTGKPLRQFINASDVALVIKQMIDDNIYESFNLTDDRNISVEEMAKLILKALGCHDVRIKYDASKPDGQYRKDVSIEKFQSFFPEFQFKDVEKGIREMYKHNFNE